ncbi:hypothetical protein P3T76_013729 [Phytophthora citrophthora]|uniref:RxLR effector protein n=1 Tax=Phytophthora citrophthora TaxID=4793 RepID=A0AAD9LCS8_9STRA|nr:hypothetical protein P3T76_013729 [Phytophthora citrophthora]
MRLSILLLAVSALASHSVSATENYPDGIAAMDTALQGGDTVPTNTNHMRFLRSEADDNEERLAGKNMFNAEKIEKALQDTTYAKTLFRRWKRYEVEHGAAFDKLIKFNIGKDDKVYGLYTKYVTWLDKHHPLGVEVTGGANLFSKAKLDKAMKDPKYENTMFGRWKRHGFESDAAYNKLLAFNLASDAEVYKVYSKYVTWLNIHHPLAKTRKTTAKDFLFNADRIARAKKDPEFAETLFKKWKTSGLDEKPVYFKLWDMGLKTDDDLYKLYTNFVKWLDTHYPLPAKAT